MHGSDKPNLRYLPESQARFDIDDDDELGRRPAQSEVHAALVRTFESPQYQPPMLPKVATELISLSAVRDVDVQQVVQVLERDSLLAGRVLKLANSPRFGGLVPIQSLRGAITRMGLREFRDLVVEAAMNSRIFRAPGYSDALDKLRMHATATAHAARAVTRFTSFEAEYAFLCGLLHEAGSAAALVALADVPRGQTLRPMNDVWPVVEELHEGLGQRLMTLWQMPVEVAMVIGNHHQLEIGGVVHPLAAIVLVAEHVADGLGFGGPTALVPAGTETLRKAQQLQKARAALGFDDARWRAVYKTVSEALVGQKNEVAVK